MFSPSLLPAGGLTYANMASFQAVTPRSSPCGEAEGSPTLHCGRCHPQPWTTLQICSGKLVYAADLMRKTKYFLGKRKPKKVKEVVIFERRREEVTWWKRWGQVFTQARLGFWWGFFPVRPGKCGPQLSRLMKATTCSSLKASLCFLAGSSCSSEHTICQQDSEVSTDMQRH